MQWIKNLIVLMVISAFCFCGCAQKQEEPVFVKNLVCSVDMDAEVTFITNKGWDAEVADVEIPNMPEGMSLDFYGEDMEKWSGYEIHTLSFGINSSRLNDSGGLVEPLVFHEINVTWDDGTTMTGNIGTIHIADTEEVYDLIYRQTSYAHEEDDSAYGEAEIKFTAGKDLTVTGIRIPYIDEVPGLFTSIAFNGHPISEITEEHPVAMKKGEECVVEYAFDETALNGYGNVFLEGQIICKDGKGKERLNIFRLYAPQNRRMPDHIEQPRSY